MLRRLMAAVGIWGVSVVFAAPSAWAAEGATAEAAEAPPAAEATLEHIRAAIAAETDPALKKEMEQQFQLLESGEVNLQDLEAGHDPAAGGVLQPPQELPGGGALPTTGGRPGSELLIGPPVDGGIGPQGESLPPEAKKELEELFKQGTGDPTSEKDQELREKAQEILEKYGIDPREMGPEHEGWEHGAGPEALEHLSPEAIEHMSPEAREQLERFYEQRETFEQTTEAPTHEYEAPLHEYEAPMHEYETPQQEYQAPEPPQSEPPQYEAPPSP